MSARTYCRENATIANAREADDLRKRCNVLEGDLTLEYGISESINLDSLEEVEGSILQCRGTEPFGFSEIYVMRFDMYCSRGIFRRPPKASDPFLRLRAGA